MDAKKITLNGENILTTGIYYTLKDWLALSTTDESRDIAGMHARYVSPTYARVRIITLEGVVYRKQADKAAVDRLRGMFRLQSPSESEVETYTLVVTDTYDNEWKIRVKIKEPLSLVEGDEGFRGVYYKWRVVLESVGGVEYTSVHPIRTPAVGYGSEGAYGGVRFGAKLGVKWNLSIASLSAFSLDETPIRIVMECVSSQGVQAPIVVLNTRTGGRFVLDADMVVGDRIEIDSERLKVTKNDADITHLRRIGSVFPVVRDSTRFVVTDLDGRALSDDIRLYGYFYNILR